MAGRGLPWQQSQEVNPEGIRDEEPWFDPPLLPPPSLTIVEPAVEVGELVADGGAISSAAVAGSESASRAWAAPVAPNRSAVAVCLAAVGVGPAVAAAHRTVHGRADAGRWALGVAGVQGHDGHGAEDCGSEKRLDHRLLLR